MDLSFQFPMQYCSLQHRTLLLSPVPSTAGCCFCFGSIPSFFLELYLHWSPVACWAPTELGSSSFSSFCLFIFFMGFSKQEYWSGFPFPSPVDHILSDLSTVTRPSWVAPHGMAQFHWVRQGCGPCDQMALCDCGFSLSALWCPLSVPTITWFSFTLNVGYLFTAAPAKFSCSLSWTCGSSSWLLLCAITAAHTCALSQKADKCYTNEGTN